MRVASFACAMAIFGAAAIPAAEAESAPYELVMFEQVGCAYCLRWHAEIGPAYPNTTEGQAAPLRILQLHDPLPGDIRLVRPAVFTPTFVLMRDGTEQGRIEGYPGDNFFWGLLDGLLEEAEGASGEGAAVTTGQP